MRLDLAMALKPGDKVINVFMDELVITSVDHSISPSITALDTRLQKHYLSPDEIYHPDLEDICDEEKSFILWAKDNKQLIGENSRLSKEIYMQGYAMGFNSKLQYSYEEQMQK
jgi:hypothetical protein